ncbi:putative helicase mov-10-B.1 [Penaeus japonicus]|uniref:putative helicase mov-10-B.1 n=1 Tax=Penaeus japonicus TaxID=27405 RepID=UPI001C7107C3|nr:putative helicase mov-10-B.1 [Penaeus japonicus]XP_042861100.1 putative helicase mov-10-B.1 [Penaeus japonicus]
MDRYGSGTSDSNNNDGSFHCVLCCTKHQDRLAFARHKTTEEHRVKWLKYWYQKHKKLLAMNKEGVELTVEESSSNMFDKETGTVSVNVTPGIRETVEFYIKNTSEFDVILINISLLHECDAVSLVDQYGLTRNEKLIRLPPDLDYVIECQIQVDDVGVEQVPIAFHMCLELNKKDFYIVRTLQANGVNQVALESGPTSLYRKRTLYHSVNRDFEGFVPGIELYDDINDALPRCLPLEQSKYGPSFKKIVEGKFNHKKLPHEVRHEAKQIKKMIAFGLNERTHLDWFKVLLWMEEIQMEVDISYYDMRGVKLKKVLPEQYSKVECVELKVPGLAEKRPSVLKGDQVYITEEDSLARGFIGCVHQVNEKSLYIALSSEFMHNFIDGKKVDVAFSFSRHTLKVCHRALSLAEEFGMMHFVFPTPSRAQVDPVQNILLFNRRLEENQEQLEAVQNIISGTSKPAPYIVFGPPGTGKTVTVVEAIKQIYKREPHSRILVSAPSNAACDNITTRLLEHISMRHIFRMHSKSREICSIPLDVKRVSNIAGQEVYFPSSERLLEYRVVICTLVAAAKIASAALPPGSISYVFLEECGQAMEPEALVGVCGVLGSDGQLVLSGDPHQLGPVIRNTLCYSDGFLFRGNGLDKSYLERLMELEMYQPVPGNRRVVTKLLKNYRSHEEILRLPNEMFYKSELQACADPVYVKSLCSWEFLPKKDFPLIFHGVKGKDEREGKSPSFFNAQEVAQVMDYVQKLTSTRHNKVLPKDIGIITPYRQQVTKIRMQLHKIQGGDGIKVGSPEEFQGDERRVIIISTVRSNADKLAYDLKYQLGFLRNCKRFNVSVTRAKALLIVVGCPEILSLDEHWGRLLDFIIARGGYCGKEYFPDGNKRIDKSILDNFGKVGLPPENCNEYSARMRAEEPAWGEE